MLMNGMVQPFQFPDKVRAQFATNYLRWMQCTFVSHAEEGLAAMSSRRVG